MSKIKMPTLKQKRAVKMTTRKDLFGNGKYMDKLLKEGDKIFWGAIKKFSLEDANRNKTKS